jgi:hypothetical protein
MKVEISKEEYLELLDLVHIASWVLIFHKTATDPRIEKYDRIAQKLYALAKDMGYVGLINYDPESKKYRPSKTLEETTETWQFIDEFVDRSFWDELTIRFIERDAARQAGSYEQLNQLTHEERHALEDPIEEKYSREFDDNGIEHLEIVEKFGNAKPVVTHD